MKARAVTGIVLLFFVCGFAAVDGFAATWVVNKTADTADGVCDEDCSLREAVVAAVTGDTLTFSPLFNSPQTITLISGQIAFSKNLTILGPGANLLTVSGNNAGRIFLITGGVVVQMSGMKLRDGRATTSADPNGGAISVRDSTLTLTSVTLINNLARFTTQPPEGSFGYGGAIRSFNSTLSVSNSIINNNTAPQGGGIYSQLGTLNITDSTINDNSGEGIYGVGFESSPFNLIRVVNCILNGNTHRAIVGSTGNIFVSDSTITNNDEGGISNDDSRAILTIERSIINNNVSIAFAGTGGGGVLNHGTASITNTVISNNHVTGVGGGIFNTGNMNILNSAITNNRAHESGGGVFTAIGQLTLTNSTVSGNLADDGSGNGNCPGGGIHNLSNQSNPGGAVMLTNSTITNNRSTSLGGGLRNDDSFGTATMRNTIIAGNLANGGGVDVSGTIISEGFNLIGNTSGSAGWMGSDLLNLNALLAPLGNNGGETLTHPLMPSSPAINAGNNALAVDPATKVTLMYDQRGLARIIAGIVDIGAYESDIAKSPVTLSGRILTTTGRGISNTRITLTGSGGIVIYALTNPFGYYRFINLPPSTTYTVNVFHKYYQFNSPQTVTVDNNRDDLNFIALP